MALLADVSEAVQSVVFAPAWMGLKIATGSADGVVRIYDVPELSKYVELSATEEIRISSILEDWDGIPCVDWCKNRFLPPMMVIGCGRERIARVFRCHSFSSWEEAAVLPGNVETVRDVCWAPANVMPYELIATCCHRSVRIFKLQSRSGPEQVVTSLDAMTEEHEPDEFALSAESSPAPTVSEHSFRVMCLANMSTEDCLISRVSWNITGTHLLSCAEDGSVQLWGPSYEDGKERWKAHSELRKVARSLA